MVTGYRKRLTLTYLIVVFSSLLIIGVYLTRSIQGYFIARLDQEMRAEAFLLSELVRPDLEDGRGIDVMDRVADDMGSKTGLRVTIMSSNGVVLGDSEEDPAAMESHATRPEVLESLKTGTGTAVRYSTTLGARLRYVAMPVMSEDGGRVVGFVRLAMPLSQVDRLAGIIRQLILQASVLVALMSAVLSVLLARSIGNPLRDMAEAAREIARGNFKRKIRVSSPDELGQLGAAFNHMAAELERSISELAERKNRMETILAAMADGVIAVDPYGRILLVNRAACEMLGVSEEQALGKYVLEAVRNHDLAEALESAMRGEADTREIKLRSPRQATIGVLSAPISESENGAVTGAVAVLHDVTEVRRLEQIRTDFVSNVSHELRTPVTSIKGFVDTLLEGAMDDRATLERFLGIISHETDRLAQIISDLLELSKLESKGTEVRKTPVSLRAVVEAALGIVRGKALQRDIHISVDISPDVPPVPADEALLVQVFVNLLDNAVKYTPEGGHVRVRAHREDGATRVDVSDTGIGIPPEHLPRIFERFYRVDKGRSRQLGGTGLGLAIVKHIVERHGGQVWVASTPGEGSTFSFTLPNA
ncbi:MAG: two-component system histidine kinase PnpS [Betaproteobacteria bacterium]